MLKAIMTNNGAAMEIDVGQENIQQGDVRIEKIFFMQQSPLSLMYFSDKGAMLKVAARYDMHKEAFIDSAPITPDDQTIDKIFRLSKKINAAWYAAVTNTQPATPDVEFVQADGRPFTAFGSLQP